VRNDYSYFVLACFYARTWTEKKSLEEFINLFDFDKNSHRFLSWRAHQLSWNSYQWGFFCGGGLFTCIFIFRVDRLPIVW